MTVQRNDSEQTNDVAVRSIGLFEPDLEEVSDEDFDAIRSMMTKGRAKRVTKNDIYPFHLIACGDGLDAYFTRHKVERGLNLMAGDLAKGQAVLGNHDYGTFSYGSSYAAEVKDADALAPEYEGVFYPKHDRPEFRTTKWLVGRYYIPRGMTLNGQSTDDLIMAMEMGAVRKASITFAPGSYECALDGKDLLMGLEAFMVDPDEIECRHFPGLNYEGALCYAWMQDSALLETSMVYKNASPSSMLVRKAEVMASRGMIPGKELVRLEERFAQRLPRFERQVHAGIEARGSQEDPTVTKQPNTTDTPAPEPQEPAEPAQPTTTPDAPDAPAPGEGTTREEGTGGSATEGGDQPSTTPEGGSGEQNAIAEFVAATEHVVAHISSGQQSDEDLVTVAEAERTIEMALEAVGSEESVGHDVARQYEARERLVREALGTEPTVEAIRTLAERATLGDTLYEELVTQAVAARTRAFGEQAANADAYRAMLLSQRNVEFVKGEIATHASLAGEKLTPRRQVTPREPTETKAPKAAPGAPREAGREQSNILARRET